MTVTDAGGVGKTSVALAVRQRLLDAFDRRVNFVELADVEDPEDVESVIVSALRLPVISDRTLELTLSNAPGFRQTLLILDNMEQVRSAAPLVGWLLVQAPLLSVLVTSCVAIGSTAEPSTPQQNSRKYVHYVKFVNPWAEPDSIRSSIRETCRCLPDTRSVRCHEPPPPLPRRAPSSQRSDLSDGDRLLEMAPANTRICRPPNSRRPLKERHHPLPKTIRRTRDLQRTYRRPPTTPAPIPARSLTINSLTNSDTCTYRKLFLDI